MKDFKNWCEYQAELECKTGPRKPILEGQVWRCAIGINTGMELDGKSKRYWRPVIVLRKFSDLLFIGVPMTSAAKGRPHHIPLTVKGKAGYAVVNQLRTLDPRRFQQYMVTLEASDLARVRSAVQELLGEP